MRTGIGIEDVQSLLTWLTRYQCAVHAGRGPCCEPVGGSNSQ